MSIPIAFESPLEFYQGATNVPNNASTPRVHASQTASRAFSFVVFIPFSETLLVGAFATTDMVVLNTGHALVLKALRES